MIPHKSYTLTFHEDFFILLNLAVGGTYAGYPDHSTPFPQYMYIDWVRVYDKNQF
jgi:beta-glucanase (GH16 family)